MKDSIMKFIYNNIKYIFYKQVDLTSNMSLVRALNLKTGEYETLKIPKKFFRDGTVRRIQ